MSKEWPYRLENRKKGDIIIVEFSNKNSKALLLDPTNLRNFEAGRDYRIEKEYTPGENDRVEIILPSQNLFYIVTPGDDYSKFEVIKRS